MAPANENEDRRVRLRYEDMMITYLSLRVEAVESVVRSRLTPEQRADLDSFTREQLEALADIAEAAEEDWVARHWPDVRDRIRALRFP